MKKIAANLALLLAVIAAAFFTFAPAYVEDSMNVIDRQPLEDVSPEAAALHQTLTIVDLHSDTLLWKRDMLEPADRGHMDLPRLQQGNVALQIFSSVTKTPKGQNYDSNSAEGDNITLLAIGQLQPLRTWGSLLERSLWHAAKLDRAVEGSAGALVQIEDAAGLTRLIDQRGEAEPQIGALLSIEGLHNLEGKMENLDRLYDAGFRMAGLTHFFDNALAGSMHGEKKGGLTPFGRDIVKRMEDRGMIIDIAHLSKAGVADVLAMATRPVVSSHGGVQATCDVNRNLSDAEIEAVAENGGIIGVGYWDGAICGTSPAAVVAAMRHIRDLVGIEHIALGSDYDGSTTVRFDTTQLAHLTGALLKGGFSDQDIRAIMGGNAIRVLHEGVKPAAQIAPPQSTPPQDDAG